LPNFVTHYYFSNLVYDYLPEELKSIVDKNRDAYKLGSVGPDLLFVLRELKGSLYANMMQYKSIKKTFEACGNYLRGKDDSTKISYMLGLINHYVLDREVHAFVNYNVEEYLPKEINYHYHSVLHGLTESAMDENILENKMKENAFNYKVHRILNSSKKTRLSIGEIYENAINKVYGYKFSKKTIATCFAWTKFFAYMIKPSKSIKIKIFKYFDRKKEKRQLESLVRPPLHYNKVDYLNNEKRPWRLVRNEKLTTNKSVYEQIEDCKIKCLDYMKDFICFLTKNTPLKLDYSVNYEGIRITE
jgi:hypothetical protein